MKKQVFNERPIEWLSPKQAAAIVGLHPNRIYEACARHEIRHTRSSSGLRARIRIARHDLDAWMESRVVEVA